MCVCMHACVSGKERSQVFASTALAVVWSAMYLAGYGDYLTSFWELPLPSLSYKYRIRLKNVWCHQWLMQDFLAQHFLLQMNLCSMTLKVGRKMHHSHRYIYNTKEKKRKNGLQKLKKQTNHFNAIKLSKYFNFHHKRNWHS